MYISIKDFENNLKLIYHLNHFVARTEHPESQFEGIRIIDLEKVAFRLNFYLKIQFNPINLIS